MKKFTKVCLIASLILILIGGSICAVGAVAGGWRLVNNIGQHGRWWNVIDRIAYAYNWDHYDDWHYWNDWDDWREASEDINREISQEIHSELSGLEEEIRTEIDNELKASGMSSYYKSQAANKEYTDTGIEKSDITEIEVNIGGAALYINESDSDTFGIRKEGTGEYNIYASQGRIYLEGNKKNHVRSNEKVYLSIPKDMTFNYIELNVGGGYLGASSLSADEMELTAGAGLIEVEQIESRDLSVDVGAGKVTLENVIAADMDISVGMGHAYVEGTITEELDAECGMGAMVIKLHGEEKDFNYDLECTAGSIQVGNKAYGALANDKYINNNAAKECSLQCSMGSIQVSFIN